jgi:hypothetical protein
MNISPDEAGEALAAIQKVSQKTRRSIAGSGAHVFLIVTGIVWLVGFLATQFLAGEVVMYIWIGMSLLGSALSFILGARLGKRVHNPAFGPTAKRAGIFWLVLVLFGIAAIAVARPADGKQVTMLIILFIMIGQSAMGLLLSFASTWWTLPITALALAGYFLLPDFFYLWMAVLVGGGMIALGVYIRLRW